MLRRLFPTLLALVVSVHALGQTADITQGCFPLQVQFTAPAGSSSWFWDFDDGATSTLQNPSNTFITAGDYTVNFSNSSGGPVVGSITINVYPKPTPTFTASPTEGCVPLNVQFTNTTVISPGITVTGWSWVFGDGGLATGANPSHTFVQPGVHFVSMALNTNLPSCNVTQQYPDVITAVASPSASFGTNPFPATACDPPLTVTFTNNSTTGAGITYDWDFGNGTTSTQQSPAAVTYTQNGNFTVSLTVTNSTGCESTAQSVVTIGSPTTSFNLPDTICFPDTIVMQNTSSPGFYTWTFGAGNIPATSNLPNPQVIFNQSGIVSVTLTTQSGQCSSSQTQTMLVEIPSAEFTSTPDYNCDTPWNVQHNPLNPGYETYDWMFGDSTFSTAVSPLHTYLNLDTNRYTWDNLGQVLTTMLIVTSSAGCVDTVMHTDTLWQPYAVMFPDVSQGCAPVTVVFSDSSTAGRPIVSWQWHLGNGQVINANTNAPQTVTYNQPGQYSSYLIVTDAQGCTDTSYMVVTQVGVPVNPQFSVSPTTVCPGEPVQFTNLTALADSVDGWHYYSENDHQFHCFNDDEPTWAFNLLTGPMDITLMAEFNGCVSTTTIPAAVMVNGPIAELALNCECDQPFVVEFFDHSHDATSILWDFGDGSTSTASNPVHTYSATGDYTVVLRAENANTGCAVSFDTTVVHIRDIRAEFNTDGLICQNAPTPFTGALSQDVHAECWGGYTWQFDHPQMRPITTTSATYPIVFPYPGPVEVTLIVKDINGCTDTAVADVRVFGIDAQFSVDQTVCPGQQITINNQSTSDTTLTGYEWLYIPDSLTVFSTAQSPVINFTSVQDTTEIFLTVSNILGCTDTIRHFMTFYEPVSFVGTSPSPNICAGGNINFNATNYTQGGSNLSFNWDFNDGTANSTSQNPQHNFPNAGTYPVVLTYTEAASGCVDSVTTVINVQAYPTASFITDSDTTGILCSPSNVVFTSTSGPGNLFTQWDFGNGQTAFGTTAGTVFNSGSYDVILTVSTSFGCQDVDTTHYTVIGPAGSFVMDLDTICRGESITFQIQDTSEVYLYVWDFGDGQTESNISPVTHTYTFVPPSGQTVAKLIVSGPSGECTVETSFPLYIHEVVADFLRNNGGDTALCFQPFPFQNQSLNANVYGWDFGDGTTYTSAQPPIHEFPGPGTYEVTLGVMNSQLGCTDTMTRAVVLYPIPVVTALGDTICEGETGRLVITDSTSSYTYTWAEPWPVVNEHAALTYSDPVLTTAYPVTVVDTNQCTSSDTAIIHVINPLVLTGLDTTIVIGDSIWIGPDVDPSLYIFEWTPDTGLTCADCPRPGLRPLVKCSYHLQVSDLLGCFTSDADYNIDIYPETFIAMPTTFTPNGDGTNDLIYVEGWGVKDLLEFRIFNRWGEEIFMTSDIETGWDGHYKGVLQNNDVYAYVVKALTWRNETKTLEGYINLLR